jgi:hypothetical protein
MAENVFLEEVEALQKKKEERATELKELWKSEELLMFFH